MQLTVEEIARRLHAEFAGEGARAVTGIAGIHEARSGDLTFVANPKYAAATVRTQAAVILVPLDFDRKPKHAALIRVESPDAAFATCAEWFAPPAVHLEPGIHPTAVIADDAQIGDGAHMGAHCVIESGARLGKGCTLYPGCYVGHHSVLGDHALLHHGVSIRESVVIGDRFIANNGSVIGSDGFGYVVEAGGARKKIRQSGTVEIGDDVEIGANVTIDRARFGKTVIGNGVKMDNLVQIGHNARIDDHAVIVAQVGISGSAHVGEHVIFAGQSGVVGHVTVGAHSVVGGRSVVTGDIPPKSYVVGFPAVPQKEWARQQILSKKLPDLQKQVKALKKRIDELESSS